MSIDKADHGGETLVRPPTHPVPQLQKPFEESMVESVDDLADQELPMDAMTRRTVLLEGKSYERVIAGRWRQKQGEKYHPLWKLIAQMSFGMHLLAKSMAISEEEVMRILQSHVDDIDGFLERTTEDFDLAQSDIHERIRCLKLPLSHGEVFDRMLEDRTFRASILDGNEKIEHVISRTKRATKDALKDVQKGFDATNVLEKYLSKLNSTWKRDSSEHEAVLVAMLGNAEGWRRAFLELHLQGNKLIGSLKKLAEVVAEMERRAAIVSRNLVARAQKSRHISFQKKSHTLSQMGSIASQKPLPTEPGRHHGSKNSSHSTQLSGLSSRPDSRHDSSRGATSHSSLGPGSRPSTASKRPVKHELHNQSLIGANSTNESLAAKDDDIRRSLNGYVKQAGDIHPIELPADVPENVLRQAPVSIKNRLSMTLGLKPKDYSDHRISSIYYPRALGDLLKTRPMSGLLLTPQSMSAKGTAVHAVSSPAAMSYAETDYYSSHERSPSIGVVTPDNSSGKETNFNKASPRATRSSTLGSVAASGSVTRRSSIPNLAFTSHSAVMAMADPPSELPAESPREESIAPSEVRKLSQSQPSSLGEPGPEFTDGATNRTRSASDPVLLVDTSVVSISVVPASAEEETFAAAGQQAQNSTSQEEESSNNRTEAETATAVSDTPDQADVAHTPAHLSDNDMEKIGADGQVVPLATAPEEAEGSQRQFVAELEAAVPRSSVVPIHKDIGPAELEAAPQQTFRLPPRPTATTKNPEKEVPRASIHNLEDFFKLPSAMTLEPGTKTKNFGSVNFQEPIGPLKLELAKRDGKIVPVRVSDRTVNDTAESASNLRLMTVADIIETMSHTPPGSPIHARSNSWASTNSAQRLSHRSSQSLGPPAQARPPPAPGGRSMVDPDFASAGQFDGERKQRKKSTIGGKSGWKTFFSGGGAAAVERPSISIAASTTVSDAPIRPRPSSEAVPRAPYILAAAGKEVPWFKGTIKRKSRKGNSLA